MSAKPKHESHGGEKAPEKSAEKSHEKAPDKSHDKKPHAAAPPSNVVSLPNRCSVKECKKSPTLVNFCAEHYEWFKFGMITKNGDKPVDFDKKQQAFMKHKKAA